MRLTAMAVPPHLLLALSLVACSAESLDPDPEPMPSDVSAGSRGGSVSGGTTSGTGGVLDVSQGATTPAHGGFGSGAGAGGRVSFGGSGLGSATAAGQGGSGILSVGGRAHGGATSGIPGVGSAGSGSTESGSGGTPGTGNPTGGGQPIIPAVEGTCPSLATGTISVTRGGKTLGGIQVVAGAKPSSPTAPLVFYWHGTGGVSSEFGVHAGAVRDGVVREGGILVSFQGTTGGDLLSGTLIFGAGDFAIADQIVACAVANYNIDPKRIFATGCSAGGLFASAMGVLRSNYMAAIAPNSGGLLAPGSWQNANSPALMTIHGKPGGDVVIVDFSVTSKTADDAYKSHGSFVVNCNHGGGHCGGGGLAPSIWTFFQAHPFGSGKPWTALPAGFSNTCMIY